MPFILAWGFYRMGTTGLVAQSQGEDAAAQIAELWFAAWFWHVSGMIIILATPVIAALRQLSFLPASLLNR